MNAPWTQTPGTWPDDKVVLLKELLAEGYSAGQVAAAFGRAGHPISRNAVIGKAHRLGFRVGKETGRPHNKGGRPRTQAGPRAPRPSRPSQTQPTSKVDDEAIPLEQRKSILQLEDHHCRWPVGHPHEPGFFYCGDPTADLLGRIPYCPAHMARADGRSSKREDIESGRATQRAYRDALRRQFA